MDWTYEKIDENYETVRCPMNDSKGEITGKVVLNLKAYFDENPEERIALGWIKHLHPDRDEIEFDEQTQYIVTSIREIDAHTVEDVYHVLDKSEERMLIEELMGNDGLGFYNILLGGL